MHAHTQTHANTHTNDLDHLIRRQLPRLLSRRSHLVHRLPGPALPSGVTQHRHTRHQAKGACRGCADDGYFRQRGWVRVDVDGTISENLTMLHAVSGSDDGESQETYAETH